MTQTAHFRYDAAYFTHIMEAYMQLKIVCALAAALLAVGTSCSRTERTITVRGSATVYAAPDTVGSSFALSSKDKNIAEAKRKNEEAVRQMADIFAAHQIEQRHINIKRISIEPRYSYRYDNTREFQHYEIRQDISVELTSLELYEPFLTALLSAGVDTISDVAFSSKQQRKLSDEARQKAVKAAEEKAQTLCAAAGNAGKKLSPGRVVSITEIPDGGAPYNLRAKSMQNAVAYTEAPADESAFSPSGQIQVSAQVEMVFALRQAGK